MVDELLSRKEILWEKEEEKNIPQELQDMKKDIVQMVRQLSNEDRERIKKLTKSYYNRIQKMDNEDDKWYTEKTSQISLYNKAMKEEEKYD